MEDAMEKAAKLAPVMKSIVLVGKFAFAGVTAYVGGKIAYDNFDKAIGNQILAKFEVPSIEG